MNRKIFGGIVLLSCFFFGCGKSSTTSENAPPKAFVIDVITTLDEGSFGSWALDAGNYKVEITSSGDGVETEWPGSDCPKTKESSQLSTICKLPQGGQMVVKNPSTIGVGDPVSVTIKVSRIEP